VIGSIAAEHRIDRVLVFDPDGEVSDPETVAGAKALIREAGVDAPVGGGTDFWFAELHRSPADFSGLDLLAFSIHPQAHTFDDESIMDTLAVHGAVTGAAARRTATGRVAVGPVTLVARDAGALRAGAAPTEDPRQGSLLLAAWTAASLGELARAGAEAVTIFELAGPRGILAADGGTVPPVFAVLHDACECAGARLLETHSGDPSRVRAHAVVREGGWRAWLANVTPDPVAVSVTAPEGLARMRSLDASSVEAAVVDPGAFRRRWSAAPFGGPAPLELELGPYAVLTIDTGDTGGP
jgi:hypothetical protein